MNTNLEAYNYLRVEAGKPQLKTWSKATAALIERGIKEFGNDAWLHALATVNPESTGPVTYSKEVNPMSAKTKNAKEKNKKNDKKSVKSAKPQRSGVKRGIGGFILEQDQKLSNAEILALVLKAFPGASTTTGSVASVRSRAKK